jgi:hypothetical protein
LGVPLNRGGISTNFYERSLADKKTLTLFVKNRSGFPALKDQAARSRWPEWSPEKRNDSDNSISTTNPSPTPEGRNVYTDSRKRIFATNEGESSRIEARKWQPNNIRDRK